MPAALATGTSAPSRPLGLSERIMTSVCRLDTDRSKTHSQRCSCASHATCEALSYCDVAVIGNALLTKGSSTNGNAARSTNAAGNDSSTQSPLRRMVPRARTP